MSITPELLAIIAAASDMELVQLQHQARQIGDNDLKTVILEELGKRERKATDRRSAETPLR